MLPRIFYIVLLDIITLLYDMPLGVTVSIKKVVSSLFTHYWLPILLILFTSLCLRQALFDWLHSMEDSVDRSSLIGDAILYTLNQENYLRRYLDDGHLSIDNNSAERAIKNFAVGRRNWLFAKSIRGTDDYVLTFVQPEKIEIDANERAVNEKSQYCFFVCTTFDSFLNDLSNSFYEKR